MIESFCYGELQLKPLDYYRLTLREYELMSDAYKRRIEIERKSTIDAWRRARLIAYNSILPHLRDKNISIFDWYPLIDDPTKEEIKQAFEDQKKKDYEWQRSVIDNFRKKKVKI